MPEQFYAMALWCPPVCLSWSNKGLKLIIIQPAQNYNRYTSVQFSDTKDLEEIPMGSNLMGGGTYTCDFWQTTCYTRYLKNGQDRKYFLPNERVIAYDRQTDRL